MRYGKPVPRQNVATHAELSQWLIEHNLSNKEGASRLGVSEKTIYNWLAGRYPRDLKERMDKADAGHAPTKGLPERMYFNDTHGYLPVKWTLERCMQERANARIAWAKAGMAGDFDRNHARDGELISGLS